MHFHSTYSTWYIKESVLKYVEEICSWKQMKKLWHLNQNINIRRDINLSSFWNLAPLHNLSGNQVWCMFPSKFCQQSIALNLWLILQQPYKLSCLSPGTLPIIRVPFQIKDLTYPLTLQIKFIVFSSQLSWQISKLLVPTHYFVFSFAW